MGMFTDSALLLVNFVVGTVLFLFVLRVLLQGQRAAFSNPISQAVYKLSNPVLMPLGKLLPTLRGWNLAGILVSYIVAVLWCVATAWVVGAPSALVGQLLMGLVTLAIFALRIYVYMMILLVLFSWVDANWRNPAVSLIYGMCEPLLVPLRRMKLAIAGFDFSPAIAILAIELIIRIPLRMVALAAAGLGGVPAVL